MDFEILNNIKKDFENQKPKKSNFNNGLKEKNNNNNNNKYKKEFENELSLLQFYQATK